MGDSTKYNSKLKGKKVLVFGGSSGIGYAAAEASIENGATVIISSSSQQRVDSAVQKILKEYPSAKDRISGFACNLGDAASLEKNVIEALEKAGKIDHIIHSAGGPVGDVIKPLSEVSVDAIIQTSMVRSYAPLIIGKHAPKYMNPGPSSSIILTTGGIVDRPNHDWVLPAMVMCSVEGLMRGLALDLAPIRVNIVCPGAVETELWSHMSKDDFEKFKQQVASNVPTSRIAQPDDIAEAYLYLMKDLNVTGSIIKTNSGSLLK